MQAHVYHCTHMVGTYTATLLVLFTISVCRARARRAQQKVTHHLDQPLPSLLALVLRPVFPRLAVHRGRGNSGLVHLLVP
uniref:Uncharacterized protein n=1 Tax=Arundo donax TaxID=35708 RepID=A0A0A9H4G5_ARUDO